MQESFFTFEYNWKKVNYKRGTIFMYFLFEILVTVGSVFYAWSKNDYRIDDYHRIDGAKNRFLRYDKKAK